MTYSAKLSQINNQKCEIAQDKVHITTLTPKQTSCLTKRDILRPKTNSHLTKRHMKTPKTNQTTYKNTKNKYEI